MDDIVAKRFANRTGVGIMAIGCHSFWSVSNHIDGLLEKAFGCFHISLLAEHAIHKVPIAIDGAIEITPLPMHLHIRARPRTKTGLLARVVWHAIDLQSVEQNEPPSREPPHG